MEIREYTIPLKPKNSLQLLKWLIFEPKLLESFSKTLSKKETFVWLLNSYLWIILISFFLYTLGAVLIAYFDLPILYKSLFKEEITKVWIEGEFLNNFINYFYMFIINWIKFLSIFLSVALGLSIALGLYLAVDLVLAVGLGLALALALALGLALALTVSLVGGLAVGLIFGLTVGLAFSLIFGLIRSFIFVLSIILGMVLALGLCIILVKNLVLGLVTVLTINVGLIIGFYIFYFRLPFYPFYYIYLFKNLTLTKNPYLIDSVIWLPLFIIDKKLIDLAFKEPKIGCRFAKFLLENRPLQRKLALNIIHSSTASNWYNSPLESLQISNITEDEKEFLPSKKWFELIEKVNSELIKARQETHIGLKKECFQLILELLVNLENETLLIKRDFKEYYLKGVREWIAKAKEELIKIEVEAKKQEPITRNIYRVGEVLIPNSLGAETFLGRSDIRDEIKFKILNSEIMPTLFLQGQRRVGKSSLLNFLPKLLGSGFKMITFDMQRYQIEGLNSFFEDVKLKVEKSFNLKESNFKVEDTLKGWLELEEFLLNLSKEVKIILAFDEYEALQEMISEDEDMGKKLLARLRSVSQHQNNLIFLFAGLHSFSDLKGLDFSKYFVHTHRLWVDYLKEIDSIKLITNPYEGFNLKFEDEIPQKVYNFTNGHPALLQHFGYEFVNLANTQNKTIINTQDLEIVLAKVLDEDNYVVSTFWREFCNENERKALIEIVENKKVSKIEALKRLKRYKFLDEDNNLRVKLFEMWIKEFGES